MITIIASSVSGLVYICFKNFFIGFAQGRNYNCYYLSNAMLMGPVAIAACCD